VVVLPAPSCQKAHYFAGWNAERDTVHRFDGAGLAHKQAFDGVAEAASRSCTS
jgi:hypothetical protein